MSNSLPLRQDVTILTSEAVQASLNLYLEDLAQHSEALATHLDEMVALAQEALDKVKAVYAPYRSIRIEDADNLADRLVTINSSLITEMSHIVSMTKFASMHYMKLAELGTTDYTVGVVAVLNYMSAAAKLNTTSNKQSLTMTQTAEILRKLIDSVRNLKTYNLSESVQATMQILEVVIDGYGEFSSLARANASDYRAGITA